MSWFYVEETIFLELVRQVVQLQSLKSPETEETGKPMDNGFWYEVKFEDGRKYEAEEGAEPDYLKPIIDTLCMLVDVEAVREGEEIATVVRDEVAH